MEETRGITWGPYLYSKWEVHYSDLVQEIVFTKNHFHAWPRIGDFKGQVVRAYLNTIWMTLCTPRCKSTTPGCYFYVFLLMVRNSTLVKKCVFYDSFFWMLLWHGADFTIDRVKAIYCFRRYCTGITKPYEIIVNIFFCLCFFLYVSMQ